MMTNTNEINTTKKFLDGKLNKNFMLGARVRNKKNNKTGVVVGYYLGNVEEFKFTPNRFKVVLDSTGNKTDWLEGNVEFVRVGKSVSYAPVKPEETKVKEIVDTNQLDMNLFEDDDDRIILFGSAVNNVITKENFKKRMIDITPEEIRDIKTIKRGKAKIVITSYADNDYMVTLYHKDEVVVKVLTTRYHNIPNVFKYLESMINFVK